jgi:hypothetical protein
VHAGRAVRGREAPIARIGGYGTVSYAAVGPDPSPEVLPVSQLTATPPPAVPERPAVRGVTTTPPRVLRWQRVAMVAIVAVPILGVAAALWYGYGRGVSRVDVGLFAGFYVATGSASPSGSTGC